MSRLAIFWTECELWFSLSPPTSSWFLESNRGPNRNSKKFISFPNWQAGEINICVLTTLAPEGILVSQGSLQNKQNIWRRKWGPLPCFFPVWLSHQRTKIWSSYFFFPIRSPPDNVEFSTSWLALCRFVNHTDLTTWCHLERIST